MLDGKKETHPSWGLVQISRISGGRTNTLFGSSVEHHHSIMLRIHRAASRRDLHRTWYSDDGEIVEVEMSPNQFAEAITTLNCGVGVPCTIRHLMGERVEPPTAASVREQFRDEFKAAMQRVAAKFDADIAAIKELLAKPTVNKADRATIVESLHRLHMELAANMPFCHTQFDEAIDKTIAEAKGEIDAFITHAVVNAGRLAIAAKMEADELAVPVVQIPALNPPAEERT